MHELGRFACDPSSHRRDVFRVDRHHVGAAAAHQPAESMIEPEERRRMNRCKA